MKTILVIGTTFHTLRSYLAEHNFQYVVLRDKRLGSKPKFALQHFEICDFSSRQSMLETLDKVSQKYKFDGVITTYEKYILRAAEAAEHLGLPGLPVAAAQACTDKFTMRQLFAKASEKISPDFAEVKNEQTLKDFAATHQFPLILKPANLAKSLLVTKAHGLDELLQNYQHTIANIDRIYRKHAPFSTPKLLVEEFMEGTIHSVDAFVDKQGQPHVLDQVVDYQTGYDIGFDDNFHYSRRLPSSLAATDIKALRHVASLGCQALGIKSSPAHIEIIMTADGPRIVEIGARNGGYRERMHGIANGIDLTGNVLAIALGKAPNIVATKNEPCAVLELFPRQPGLFKGIANEPRLKQLPSLIYYDVKYDIGRLIGTSSGGYKMTAVIILHNSNRKQFQADLEFVNSQVFVECHKDTK